MIIGLLISTIGLLPLVLGFVIRSVFKELRLSNVLFLFMVAISIWQLDVGVLYLGKLFPPDVVLFLFKLFRMGPTFAMLILFYLTYRIVKDQPSTLTEYSILTKSIHNFFNKRNIIIFAIWSIFVYIINWTNLGVSGVAIRKEKFTEEHYFPIYGHYSWIYLLHMSSFILFLFFTILVSKRLANTYFQKFLITVYIDILGLLIIGFVNFSDSTGLVASSFGVIAFSAIIVQEFIKLNVNMKANYYQILERQKKLDYTGNLAGSLIHEVKNTNQIIVGFSNILSKSEELTEKERSLLEMIQKSSEHLSELTDNYKKYIKSSNLTFKTENLQGIIQDAIDFSMEMSKEKQVSIQFKNDYDILNAYMNKANIKQVFINLIKNSIEAMDESKEDKTISIQTEMIHETIIIHFIDNGKGIPKSNWESVFDPFISFKSRGMGLGLPFVKKILIEHFGDIQIQDSSEKGTHFRIEIPQNGILNQH